MKEFTPSSGLQYPSLVYVYVDWCVHCRRAKPLMEQLSSRLGISLPVVAINDDDHKDFIKTNIGNVRSYPTILYLNTLGQATKFEGERSMRNLMDFVCTESSKVEGKLDACDI